nr:Zinc finger, C2H2 domain containing protein [Ipomoea batatas]GMD94030.1 Zinc finger, C2H2 domain containing protein [Ipomoea batatas]GME08180.1 Zinc finger, C2H2 domain containing protein [Ipomoea batatas]
MLYQNGQLNPSFFRSPRTVVIFIFNLPFDHNPTVHSSNLQNPKNQLKPAKALSSWYSFKSLLTCKQVEGSAVHDPSKNAGGYELGGPCGSICSFRETSFGLDDDTQPLIFCARFPWT